MKIQKATWHETMHITIGVAAFSVIMNIVFAVVGRWDLSVLLGTVLGAAFAVANFLLMGITVQNMAKDADIKHAKQVFQFSYSLRQLAMVLVVILGFTVHLFNGIAVVIPLLFPKFTILIMQMTGMYKPDKKEEGELDER
ncbi:MAG: ATP synthase subunit I [Oscillospiraceae bacterium]